MNYWNRNNHERPTSIKDAIQKLPYGFAPVDKDKLNYDNMVPLDKDDESLITGHINCEMYALNELCVGNTHKDLGHDKVEIAPLTVDGKVVIPSSTLKGCFANFLAAYLQYPISRMNNRQYGFRPNNAPSGKSVANYAGIIESIAEDNSITVKRFKERYYAFTKYKYSPAKASRHNYRDTNHNDRPLYKYQIRNDGDKSAYFYFYDYHDGLDGAGTLGKLTERPASHQSFGVRVSGPGAEPEYANERYIISPDCYDAYLRTVQYIKDEKDGHLQDHPQKKNFNCADFIKNVKQNSNLKEGDLIFFEVLTKDETKVITFGKHYRYRWAFSRSLHDFDQDYQAENAESIKGGLLNRIEEMFGYSSENKDIPYKQRAKSAKVHFSCAVHESGTGKSKDMWLPRAGSPKPSSYEFYLKENFTADKHVLLSTFGDPAREDHKVAPRLSGRKFYYRKRTISPALESDGMIKLVNVLSPSSSVLPKFTFHVYYENLRPMELELLCFALNLGQNIEPSVLNMDPTGVEVTVSKDGQKPEPLLCHQIGYGKNHGMGAVKVVIEEKDGKAIVHRFKLNHETGRLLEFHRSCTPRNFEKGALYDLCKLYRDPKHYPSFKGDIFTWHTTTKNSDLKKRKN